MKTENPKLRPAVEELKQTSVSFEKLTRLLICSGLDEASAKAAILRASQEGSLDIDQDWNCASLPQPSALEWLLKKLKKGERDFIELANDQFSGGQVSLYFTQLLELYKEEFAEKPSAGQADVEVFADHAEECMQPIGLTTCGYPRAHIVHNDKASMSYHNFMPPSAGQTEGK